MIDPGLAYSTFLGGAGIDEGGSIAVDPSGAAYVTGHADAGFPSTAGSYDPSHNSGGGDVFVSKLNPAGTALVYSTFIGGSAFEQGRAIALDSAGQAHVTGQTASADFPGTPGAFETAPFGGGDVFVAKLNASGTDLVYSTYLGGMGSDTGLGLAVDSSGAYVAGAANSSDFPTTSGAPDRDYGGASDAFIAKFDPAGASLAYSTFLGGSNFDYATGVAVRGGEAFTTGVTASEDFLTTMTAFDSTHNGQSDAFASKLNQAGSGFAYSTYLGGSGFDQGNSVAVDSGGSAYVVGNSGDDVTDYPTTAGAFDTDHNGSNDAFVTKLNATASALDYSSYSGRPRIRRRQLDRAARHERARHRNHGLQLPHDRRRVRHLAQRRSGCVRDAPRQCGRGSARLDLPGRWCHRHRARDSRGLGRRCLSDRRHPIEWLSDDGGRLRYRPKRVGGRFRGQVGLAACRDRGPAGRSDLLGRGRQRRRRADRRPGHGLPGAARRW